MKTLELQIKEGDNILHPETDVNQVVGLPGWTKTPQKPEYTVEEIEGAVEDVSLGGGGILPGKQENG